MPELYISRTCIPISHIGCGLTRRFLLGLEPGSRIWLKVENEALLFERMQDEPDGQVIRGLKVVEPSIDAWQRLCREHGGSVVELTATERPLDDARSAERWVDDDLPDHVPIIFGVTHG